MIIFLTSCSSYSPTPVEQDNVEVFTKQETKRDPHTLYVESSLEQAKYEPQKGAYLGAYVLANKQLNFSAEAFEELTEKKHAIYLYNMKLDDEFPETWILSCIKNKSTPLVTIKPPNDYNPFDAVKLIEAAKKFGKYDIPIFVSFYPEPSKKGFNPNAYKDYFKKAYNAFSEHAPNTAMIFGVSRDEMIDYKKYYPGDNYVDWVGLNIYEPIQEADGLVYGNDIFEIIDYYYYTFQKTKPIMLTQFGVSYYSSEKKTYFPEQSMKEIQRVYNNIATYYPRIKGIVYMDFNGMGILEGSDLADNYSVTEDEKILNEYKNIISSNFFLSNIETNNLTKLKDYIKSPFEAYYYNDKYYISEKSFQYDFGALRVKGVNFEMKKFDGQTFYDMDIIETSGLKDFSVDKNNKKVYLYN
jgi:hypothetical protein